MTQIKWRDAKKELPQICNECLVLIKIKETSDIFKVIGHHNGYGWFLSVFDDSDEYELLYWFF